MKMNQLKSMFFVNVYNQRGKIMKKYTQIFMMLLMASVGANVYCGDLPPALVPTAEQLFDAEILQEAFRINEERMGSPMRRLAERRLAEGSSTTYRTTQTYAAIAVAAFLIAAIVEHQTGFLRGSLKYIKGKIWVKEASTADEEEELRKIMEQLTPDEQRQAVELAGELIHAESKEAAAVEQIVEQPKKSPSRTGDRTTRPSRTGGRKTTRTRR